MQILKGALRGQKIKVPPGVRPVSQRVKKSCFSIMSGQIKAKRVLDCFAGSGSLGIEALSCGAAEVFFIDKNRNSIRMIKKNLLGLKVESCFRLFYRDIFLAGNIFRQQKGFFDLIFIDPPYSKGLLTKSLQLLESYDILSPFGYAVGFCYKKEAYQRRYGKLFLLLERSYGQSTLLIYRNESNEKGSLSGDV